MNIPKGKLRRFEPSDISRCAEIVTAGGGR